MRNIIQILIFFSFLLVSNIGFAEGRLVPRVSADLQGFKIKHMSSLDRLVPQDRFLPGNTFVTSGTYSVPAAQNCDQVYELIKTLFINDLMASSFFWSSVVGCRLEVNKPPAVFFQAAIDVKTEDQIPSLKKYIQDHEAKVVGETPLNFHKVAKIINRLEVEDAFSEEDLKFEYTTLHRSKKQESFDSYTELMSGFWSMLRKVLDSDSAALLSFLESAFGPIEMQFHKNYILPKANHVIGIVEPLFILEDKSFIKDNLFEGSVRVLKDCRSNQNKMCL
jgi:hypothetical protein